jgi:GT2 family glycosyltransferase
MKISLVVPTYNRKETLRCCLSAAIRQDYPNYEVIVVEDASTDGTGEMVGQAFPQVRYYRLEPNRGPAAARNSGIREATGEIVAFTDDDCLVPPDFISQLADGYRRYPHVAGVGGYLEAPDAVVQKSALARYEAYVTHRVYNAGSEPYLGGFDCPAGGTNSMSYRRDVLQAVGGFDETFRFAAGEDADLKWRVVMNGHQLLYLPLRVIHLRGYTFRNFLRQHFTRGGGAVHFERKHGGGPPSVGRLFSRGGIRLLRWWRDLFRIGPGLATINLVAELLNLSGQWWEIRRVRRKTGHAI